MNNISRVNKNSVSELEQIANRYFEQAEIDFLRKNENFKVEVYFDTHYVLGLIQGYWELQTNLYNIDLKVFNDDKFLVKALTYLGYIKNVKLFLPHAAELKKQLEKTYLLPSESFITQDDIDNFLHEIKLSALTKFQDEQIEDKIDLLLESFSPYAETAFKANYIISELLWTKRFNYLFHSKNQIIQYDSERYKSEEIIGSPIFKKIINSISKGKRIHKTVNNLRDTLALCMFHEKIKKFEKGDGPLPLFYVTTDIHSKLSEDIKKEFIIELSGKSINLLKDTEYFIVDAIFNNNGNESEVFKKLQNIKQAVNIYPIINVNIPTDDIESLISSWKKYRNHDFFQRIWQDEQGGKVKLSENIKHLFRYKELIKNETELKKTINDEKNKIISALNERVSNLEFLEQLWKEISDFKPVLDRFLNKESFIVQNGETDVFRDEGLTRFSPPIGIVEDQIKMLWQGFLDSYSNDQEEVFQRLQVTLTKLIYEGCFKPGKKDLEKILIGVSLLWIFRKYNLIIKIIEILNKEYGEFYQIELFYIASLIKDSRYINKVKKISELISKIELRGNFRNDYRIAIALAYIKFNVWYKFYQSSESIEKANFKQNAWGVEAINLNKKAYEYLGTCRNEEDEKSIYRNVKYYYALNNFIYYSINANARSINNKDFHKYVEELEKIQSSDLYRQSRFSDTIARYYYQKSLYTLSSKSKKEFLDSAEEYIDNAIKTCVFLDEEFGVLKNRIRVSKEDM